mmetsp:Transcript_15988/g.45960  ORF Transcript_15988/g.45960 Transcript_15988/m.45960 type:complete len:249 (+) Transcript_15988:310-1056(+)
MVITEALQFLHGSCSIFPVHEGHKGEPSRHHGLLVLGEVDAANPAKGLEEILQVGLGSIFGDVGDSNRILVPVLPEGSSPWTPAFWRALGHGGERLRPSHSRWCTGASAGGWGHILSGSPSGGLARCTDLGPSVCLSLAASGVVGIHVVLPLQLTALLLCPKGVQVSREGLGHILVLEVCVGVGVVEIHIVPALNGHVRLVLVYGRLAEFLPLPALLDVVRLPKSVAVDLDFGHSLDELVRVGWVATV